MLFRNLCRSSITIQITDPIYSVYLYSVEDLMVIAGGRKTTVTNSKSAEHWKTLDVILAHGSTCAESNHNLPELPKTLEGFGMTSRKDTYLHVCGGIKKTSSCFTTCGMYKIRSQVN